MSPHAPLRRELAATAARLDRPDWRRELQRSLQLLGYAALYRPHTLRWAYGAPLRRALRSGDRVAAAGMRRSRNTRSAPGAKRSACAPVRAGRRSWRRRAQGRRRSDRLAAIAGLRVVADSAGAQGNWPALLVLLPDAAARERALAQLWPRGLGVDLLFVHALPDYAYLHSIVDATRCPTRATSPRAA